MEVVQNLIGLAVFAGFCYGLYRFVYLPAKARRAARQNGGGGGIDKDRPTQDQK